ncbi:MAG: Clp protease N-terminal domain-containing protein, partial [bacterium]
MKLEKDLNRVIASAFYEAKQKRHEYVTPEHLLYSALHSEQGRDIISSLGGDIDILRAELKKHMKKHIPILKTGSVMQSRSFQELMNIAATRAASAGKKHVHLTDMLVAFYDCEECFATWFLLNQGIERYEMVEYVSHGFIA